MDVYRLYDNIYTYQLSQHVAPITSKEQLQLSPVSHRNEQSAPVSGINSAVFGAFCKSVHKFASVKWMVHGTSVTYLCNHPV